MNELEKMASEPRLYLLMRSDLYQMNPGKLAAQAAHASCWFMDQMHKEYGKILPFSVRKWLGDRGFGTKIVLSATLQEITDVLRLCNWPETFHGLVNDPSYPFYNEYGETFTTEEITCGYVFLTPNSPWELHNSILKLKLHV